MPIYINNKKLENINIANTNMDKVYIGNTLVFQKNNLQLFDVEMEQVLFEPFEFTINTNLGTGSTFDLPLRSGYNYDFIVDWGDGSNSTITSYNDSDNLHTYSTHGTYEIKITGLCEAWYFNNTGDKNKLISIEKFGYTGFKNMEAAFRGCTNLTIVSDVDGYWCRYVNNMYRMFRDCTLLTNVNVANWLTDNVVNIGEMFYECINLQTLDLTNWNVSNVIDMGFFLFSFVDHMNITNIGDVSNWDVSNVTNMSSMFSNCKNLTNINVTNWNIGNVTNISSMFSGCISLQSLDLTNWDVSNVIDMGLFLLVSLII